MHVDVCVDVSFQFLWLNKQGAWLLCYTIRLCLVLRETAKPSSQVAIPFTVPTNRFLFHIITNSQHQCEHLDFSLSNRCVILPHCFNFHFLNEKWYWACFHVLICHLYVFFCMRYLFISSVHSVILLFPYCCFKRLLCIMDTSPLSDMWFAKISSLSVACHFILFTVSFAEQSFLILM